MTFIDELNQIVEKKKRDRILSQKMPMSHSQLKGPSLMDKVKGIKGAFKRIKEQTAKEGKNSIWASETEIAERQVCCTTCTNLSSCPYCGCQIKRSCFGL